jgi:hypothetical protein
MERVINEILAGIDGVNFYAGIYLVDDLVTEVAPIVGLSTREERVRRLHCWRGRFCRYRRRSARGAVMSEDKRRRLGIGAAAVLSSCLIVDSFGQ